MDITAIILTFNEEIHIERCIESAKKLTNSIIVVDSFSTDRTAEIALSLNAQVVTHAFVNHSSQLSWALENLQITTEWVLRVDADEIISNRLASEIISKLPVAKNDISAFSFTRRIRFQGRLIRYGGSSHSVVRLWRNGRAFVENRWMDEHMLIKCGVVLPLDGALVDENLNGITWWIEKHNGYATREAIDILSFKYDDNLSLKSMPSGEASLRRNLKNRLYLRLPLGVRAFLLFFYRMTFQLGFLDGAGFKFHFLQCLWYRFLVDIKVWRLEQRMNIDKIGYVEAIKKEHNINLSS